MISHFNLIDVRFLHLYFQNDSWFFGIALGSNSGTSSSEEDSWLMFLGHFDGRRNHIKKWS
ncbi:hypothetical protein [Gramella sp. AN32]|uniref:Uncharacterized protein n=1 Tax=Christiangramia antarctica TaxID=2058158 RepID=A0ABW5X5B7_9FLAO|nr:hypothetical protein [Gramella sp. AN32]